MKKGVSIDTKCRLQPTQKGGCVILKDKFVKTNKRHLCFACNREILKGTIMHFQTNVTNKWMYNNYTCKTCKELLSTFPEIFLDEEDNSFPELCVWNELGSNENPEEYLRRLNFFNC